MARRREHTLEQIKEMIIVATENIILKEGLEALTARKIALDIGYTVGSIYMVFENMQELMMHVNARTLRQLADSLQVWPEESSIEQRLRVAASNYLQFAADNANRWRVAFAPQNSGNSAWPDWYSEQVRCMFEPIENLFRQLKPEAEPRCVQLAAKTYWCSVHGVCLLAVNGYYLAQHAHDCEEALDFIVSNFIQNWKS